MALDVGRELGLDSVALKRLELGALFHDIGKIGIASTILLKPGPLTQQERAVMETHPELGERILAPIARLEAVRPIVRHCHERWDGKGYPDALGGGDIPIESRVIFVCDAFHAMTTDRPYRRAMSLEDACKELEGGAGSQFDPDVVAAFLRLAPGRARDAPPLVVSGFRIGGVSEPLNIRDFERLAEAKVEAGPVGYFVGGSGTSGRSPRTSRRSGAGTCGRACSSTSPRSPRRRPCSVVRSRCPSSSRRRRSSTSPTRTATPPWQEAPRRPERSCASSTRGRVRSAARRSGVRREALVPALLVARPRLHPVARRSGLSRGLRGDRPHRRSPPAAGRRERDIRAAFEIPTDLPLPNLSDHLGRGDFHAALSEVVDPSVTWRDLSGCARSRPPARREGNPH